MKKALVVLVVLLVALATSWAFAQDYGTIGRIEMPQSSPAATLRTTAPRALVAPVISVSFTGTDADTFRREFMRLAETKGQPVDVQDWRGKYRVILKGETQRNSIQGSLFHREKRTNASARISGWVTWRLIADVKIGSQYLFFEEASASGPRTNLNLYGSFSRRTRFSLGGSNSWLGQSLRDETVEELVPRIFSRLQQLEALGTFVTNQLHPYPTHPNRPYR